MRTNYSNSFWHVFFAWSLIIYPPIGAAVFFLDPSICSLVVLAVLVLVTLINDWVIDVIRDCQDDILAPLPIKGRKMIKSLIGWGTLLFSLLLLESLSDYIVFNKEKNSNWIESLYIYYPLIIPSYINVNNLNMMSSIMLMIYWSIVIVIVEMDSIISDISGICQYIKKSYNDTKQSN